MKSQYRVFAPALLSFILISAQGQPMMGGGMGRGMGGGLGAMPSGPHFGGDTAKIFGVNKAFSATLEMHSAGGANGGEIVMPGKLAYLEGKSRFEMDLSEVKGMQISPQQAAQMKQFGMGDIIAISRPDKQVNWQVFPGLQAYVETAIKASDASASADDYTISETELGKETVDGHDCVKKKVVVTGKDGAAHESTVWSAGDLHGFPVKIEATEGGSKGTMLFKDIKLDKPDAAQFDVGSDLAKYSDMQTMMMQQMMKRMGRGGATP